jgi:hypothetical protein
MRGYCLFFKSRRKIAFIAMAFIFLLLFIISFQLSVFYPIYSDEFEWKLISSRFFLDQGKLIYLFPACLNSYVADTPLSWYPGRILDGLIYQGTHANALLRYLGLIQYIILIFLFWQIAKIQSKLNSVKSFLLVVSFFSIGVLPILMIINRPEQPLLLYVTICVYLSVYQTHKPCRFLTNSVFVTLLFCVLSNLIITTHPKGIYLLPVVFVAYRQIVKSFVYLFVFLGITFWTVIQTIHVWSTRTTCSESPWLEELVKSFTLNPVKIFSEPELFLLQISKNIIRFYTYIQQMLFSTNYQSQWLPSLTASNSINYVLWIINSLCWISIATIFGTVGYRFVKKTFNKVWACNQLGIALIFSVILVTVMQIAKNFYESALILPLLFLILLFLIHPQDETCRKFISQVALPILLVIGCISSYTRYILFIDHLPEWKSASQERATNQLHIENFAQNQCGINTFASGLVVDRQTYPTFWKHPFPVFISGLTGWYGTGTDYKITLNRLGSDGLVAMCTALPKELRDIGKEDSGVCCISKSSLEQLIKQ